MLCLADPRRVLEMTQPQPRKVRIITPATLRKWAVADAIRQATGPSSLGLDSRKAFTAWMSRANIAPYFMVGNPIGLTLKQAHDIKLAYFANFDGEQARLRRSLEAL